MHKLHFFLLLGSFQVIYVTPGEMPAASHIATLQTAGSPLDESDQSLDILPLTLIKTGTSRVPPTKLEDIRWTNDGLSLSGGTKFNTDPEEEQLFFCSIPPLPQQILAEGDSLEDTEEEYCNYSTSFKDTEPLSCAHEPKFVVEKIFTNFGTAAHAILCGPKLAGKYFRLVYKVCATRNPIENGTFMDAASLVEDIQYIDDFEAFRFCYDEEKHVVLHTMHKIRSPQLLANDALKNERNKSYNMVIDANNFFEFNLNILPEQYKNLDQKIESNTAHQVNPEEFYVTKKTQILQKLVPPEDFAFALWKKPTYSLAFYKPMREDLVDLWNYISTLIRKDAIKKNREYTITTAAYMYKAPDTDDSNFQEVWARNVIYQYNQSYAPNELPKYKGIAIVMTQYFDDPSVVTDPLQTLCPINLCENAFIERFHEAGKSIHCCSMVNSPQATIKVDHDLELDFLQYEEETPLN